MRRPYADRRPGRHPDCRDRRASAREHELDQAERLVESFLVLARAERGVMDDLTTVSLPQITADALDTADAS